jgi:hypothetical protein
LKSVHFLFREKQKAFILEKRMNVIAPGQSEICFMDFSQVNKPVNFNVEYTSGSGKKYVEKYTVNLTAGSMLKADYRPDDAVIYARYSSDSQREESIEGQIRECTEYAKRNGITISRLLNGSVSSSTATRMI